MNQIKLREGIIDQIAVAKDYILLQTTACIYHLPLTTEILHSSTGKPMQLSNVKKGYYFHAYSYNGQHLLAVNEKDSFYGVFHGEYHEKNHLIDDQLMMNLHPKTKKYGSTLVDGAQVIAFCRMMTRSIPPQSTPDALFIFKKRGRSN
ncbi:MAG TPA: hypothetical protein VIG43_02250 [Kurthia sp.]